MDPYNLNQKSSIKVILLSLQKKVADKIWEYINPPTFENLCNWL